MTGHNCQDRFERKKLEEELPGITSTVYLNSAGQGPKPRRTIETIKTYYEKTLWEGACVKPLLTEINQQVEKVRYEAASFLNVKKEEIAMIRCVAEGINILLDGLDLKEGDEIITSFEENPAVLIPIHTFAEEKGALVRKIELPNNKDQILENLKQAITKKTRLVVLSHVTHTRGLRIPAKEIGEICHAYNIWFALDGAQAVGQIPVDCSYMGCDCYFAAGYKWLLGVHGTTIAVFRRQLLERLHIRYNGVGSQSAFSFATDEIDWKKDAARLEYGSRCWPLYIGLGKSIEYLSALGIDHIERQVQNLRKDLVNQMTYLGFICESPEEQGLSSGILTFTKKGVDMEDLVAWLYNQHNILVQYRNFSIWKTNPQGLRVSVGFFNTQEELVELSDKISAYMREKREIHG